MSEQEVEAIAKIAHEINKSYCEAIGDTSQKSWDTAPDIIKNSAKSGVLHHLMNPDTTPAESHAVWMHYKQQEGWVYGEEKDVEKKTHPCLVPYEQLPESQRVKDFLFSTIVKQTNELVKTLKNSIS